ELLRMLQGRMGVAHFVTKSVSGGTADVEVQVPVVDPMNRIKPQALHYVRTDPQKQNLAPNADGTWPEMPGTQRVDLVAGKPNATATFKVTAAEKMLITYSFQTSYVNAEGKTLYSEPGTFNINFSGPPPVVVNKPPEPPKDLTDDDITKILAEM